MRPPWAEILLLAYFYKEDAWLLFGSTTASKLLPIGSTDASKCDASKANAEFLGGGYTEDLPL